MMRRVLLTVFGLCLVACAALSPDFKKIEARTASDVLADVISPTSLLSKQACLARQQAEVQSVKDGLQTTAQAEPKLRKIQDTCEELHEIFLRIQDAHAQGATMIEQGKFDEAREHFNNARDLYRAIADKLGGVQ